MSDSIKSVLYIFGGGALIFLVAGEILARLLLAFLGFYLIIQGLRIRNNTQFMFFMHRHFNRSNDQFWH